MDVEISIKQLGAQIALVGHMSDSCCRDPIRFGWNCDDANALLENGAELIPPGAKPVG